MHSLRHLIFLIVFVSSSFSLAANEGLQWGTLLSARDSQSQNLQKDLKRVLEIAAAHRNDVFTAESEIVGVGKLPTEDGVSDSHGKTEQLVLLPKLAVCARLSSDADLKAACIKTARQGLLVWATTYKPTGNPINESKLVPWVQAWDLMRPVLNDADNHSLESFARALIATSDKFYHPKQSNRPASYENWASWRVCLRSMLALVLRDQALIASSREFFNDLVAHNIEADGSSRDFHHRDALHYHVYDMQALMDVMAQAPADFSTDASKASVERGVSFLKPYVLGEKTHIEFLHSTVAFDLKRKNAGLKAYQNVNWRPEDARKLLRLARAVFPSVKGWTGQLLTDESYDPMLQLLTAALGD